LYIWISDILEIPSGFLDSIYIFQVQLQGEIGMSKVSMRVKIEGQPPEDIENVQRLLSIAFFTNEDNVMDSRLMLLNVDHEMVNSLGNYLLRIARAMKEGKPIPKMYQDIGAPKQLGNRIIAPQNGLILPN